METWLTVVAAQAKALREVGVRSLELPGVLRLELDEAPPVAYQQPTGGSVRTIDMAGGDDDEPTGDLSDPLNDPTTFPSGRVPGFQRPRRGEAD